MKKMMERLAAFVLAMVLIVAALPTAEAATSAPLYGKLTISDAGISVKLYNSNSQTVCDRDNSACFYAYKPYSGMIIADHCDQAFKNLNKVKVGTKGKITQNDGGVINIKCTKVFDGHNTGKLITDGSGKCMLGKADYLTYTCMNGWTNVRGCLWTVTSKKNVNPKYDSKFKVDSWTVNKVPATSVKLSKTSATLAKGKTLTLAATMLPTKTTDTITWTSSDKSIATVTSAGKVTAVKPGTVTIKAKTASGKTAKCTITVTKPSTTSISLKYSNVTLAKGGTVKLASADLPSNLTWKSSNTKIALVNSTGMVMGMGTGTATITVTTSTGKTANCTITVK